MIFIHQNNKKKKEKKNCLINSNTPHSANYSVWTALNPTTITITITITTSPKVSIFLAGSSDSTLQGNEKWTMLLLHKAELEGYSSTAQSAHIGFYQLIWLKTKNNGTEK